jgi:two-component system KDP operon response regulator KdpE
MSIAKATQPLVLIVEDETPMRKFLRAFLSGAGYRSIEAASGEEALQFAVSDPPDLVILDLGLPDIDGQEVLGRLREWLTAPIIILSVRNQDTQKISALDRGANDYLTKPFSTGELLARMRVALRHASSMNAINEPMVYECDGLKVDLGARRVFVREEEVRLTPLEYKLMLTMVHNVGKVLTHQFLLESVWGVDAPSRQHLRVFMAGLRRKIEADPAQPKFLLTEQGVGYRLASD